MTILARNLRTRHGELDILAQEGDTWVVVEVRTVSHSQFLGHPAAAITLSKARQVLRATRQWMARRGERRRNVRIDAIGIDWTTGQLEHLRGAIRWDMEASWGAWRRRQRGW